ATRRASAVAADRRNLPRRESDCSVALCCVTEDEGLTRDRIEWMIHASELHGRLVDVSMSGVALNVSEQLAPGARIALRISNRPIGRHVDASATVLRCRPDPQGGWSVVCRFARILTFEQIHLVGRNLFAATIV